MLIWVAALHCEAKPIIDYYRLKKSPHHSVFDLYQNDSMQCVICGMGKISAAAATAWVAALNDQQSSICWINIGTAGAADKPVGDIFRLNKIVDHTSDRNYYPISTFPSPLSPIACITLEKPCTEYHSSALFDMEASSFFATASRFSTAELVHCIKVVSDNSQQQTGYDKSQVSNLIGSYIDSLDNFAQNLQALNHQLIELEVDPLLWQKLLQQAHFSQTQQARLKALLRYLLNDAVSADSLVASIKGLTSSRGIIATLEQSRQQLARNL